jgi:UDP-glucose 4-epimerase
MRALVTGGAGFIGSNLVDRLLDRGEEVFVIDDLSTGRESNLTTALERGAKLNVLDIREAPDVAAAFTHARPDVVFHLAAQIDVRRSIADPVFDAGVNVQGTINVLESARAQQVSRLVNTSTGGAIYGAADVLPTPETAIPEPEAAYGQSKYAAEGYCGLYERLYRLSSVTLRYGNVYGPRQDPLGEAGVIAIFCGCLMSAAKPTVFGDGLQTRDYVYVSDVVEANLAAIDHPGTSGAFNIGTGRETSVLELVEALAELSGTADFTPQLAPARLGELQRSCLDVRRAAELLGWRATIELRDGLAATLAAT